MREEVFDLRMVQNKLNIVLDIKRVQAVRYSMKKIASLYPSQTFHIVKILNRYTL